MDPLQTEQLFERVQEELKTVGSERVQLVYIYHFLEAIDGNFRTYDSYIIQLFEDFPTLRNPLLFTGFYPEKLTKIISLCEKVLSKVPELKAQQDIETRIDHLKVGLQHVQNWVGVDRDKKAVSVSGVQGAPYSQKKKDPSSLFIPVIESAAGRQSGRLRKLSLKLTDKAKDNAYYIHPVFGVIGAQAGKLGEIPAKAAGNLLQESVERSSYWEATAHFELSHSWHAGRSANLALAGLFYCEMLQAENKREYFKLNPGIAITGDIDESGAVKEVDEESLAKKVEATFFSWVQVLVVPVQQLDEVSTILENLEKEFPSRNLIIKGVGNLRELFYDRRLSLHYKTSLIEHSVKKIWKKKNSTGVALVILVLLAIIGRLVYGPVDRNPVYVDFEGEFLVLENTNGVQVGKINVGEIMVENMSRYRHLYPTFELHDINKDGVNELIWGNSSNSTEREKSYIRAWSVSGDSMIWEQEMNFNFTLPKQHIFVEGAFFIREIKVANTRNGYKVIALTSESYSFPAVVSLLDIETGKIEQEYFHSGHFGDLELIDINKDGNDEIILTGVNNAFWEACLVVLDPLHMSGHSPLKGDYFVDNTPKAKEMYYIFLPKTKIGVALSGIQKFNQGRRIYKEEQNDVFWVEIMETTRSFAGTTNDAYVTAYFNFDMKALGFGTSNLYDIIARELYESGEIHSIPDYDYWEAFKDSLLYWDGESFQYEPTMNKEYLQTVGKIEE